MIPIQGFMDLDNELILKCKLYHESTTTQTGGLCQNSNKTCRFSSKMGFGLTEECETGVKMHL